MTNSSLCLTPVVDKLRGIYTSVIGRSMLCSGGDSDTPKFEQSRELENLGLKYKEADNAGTE